MDTGRFSFVERGANANLIRGLIRGAGTAGALGFALHPNYGVPFPHSSMGGRDGRP